MTKTELEAIRARYPDDPDGYDSFDEENDCRVLLAEIDRLREILSSHLLLTPPEPAKPRGGKETK